MSNRKSVVLVCGGLVSGVSRHPHRVVEAMTRAAPAEHGDMKETRE